MVFPKSVYPVVLENMSTARIRDSMSEFEEVRWLLIRIIANLPEDLRVAVILRDVQGLSNQEAADTLDISVSALKARLHRGRIALRDSLIDYVEERASSG